MAKTFLPGIGEIETSGKGLSSDEFDALKSAVDYRKSVDNTGFEALTPDILDEKTGYYNLPEIDTKLRFALSGAPNTESVIATLKKYYPVVKADQLDPGNFIVTDKDGKKFIVDNKQKTNLKDVIDFGKDITQAVTSTVGAVKGSALGPIGTIGGAGAGMTLGGEGYERVAQLAGLEIDRTPTEYFTTRAAEFALGSVAQTVAPIAFKGLKYILRGGEIGQAKLVKGLQETFEKEKLNFDPKNWAIIETWKEKKQLFKNPNFEFKVREKTVKIETHTESLSHSQIPKVSSPKYSSWGDILRWVLQENYPGEFPFTAGLFPFKREGEDPTRMFAGEGGPERTNKRFHYVSLGLPAKRLSTAFDSVTLYGNDPDLRPDIYGKIGNSGVSICCLDDAKKLYSGFDLSNPSTSVSMTINGPAPMLLGFFMNAAIDQNCEKYITENSLEAEIEKKIVAIYKKTGTERPKYQGELPEGNNGLGLMLLGVSGDQVLDTEIYSKIKTETLKMVRGTVQADILKEDQAQNTCIFSTEFALRLMGDVQQYFIDNGIRNFYSVSISGYHIAEAGANPITQLAFTLANGFTYVEYYLSRGMNINDFGPNLSFFFSNGIDPEYAVIGRVARRIWAKALAKKYGANSRAQMLKYHIQTSGRSLHAQEIDFNDIRTTLQALYAIYDNCNSLHTNAYDEAITTPTEESVRRAMAIQLIINRELGLTKNENPLQGSFIIDDLTDLVEEAVLLEFDRITERGGVLGAMETMYQRSKIQEESLYYETLKHTGEFPIIGVNTFLSSKGSPTILPKEVIRATEEEKEYQIKMLKELQIKNKKLAIKGIERVQDAAINNRNMFEELMETCKYSSLGQITEALFSVGGQYRRNM